MSTEDKKFLAEFLEEQVRYNKMLAKFCQLMASSDTPPDKDSAI